MPIERQTRHCWVITPLNPEWPAYHASQDAAMKATEAPDAQVTAAQLKGPCWIVRCDGTGPSCCKHLSDGQDEVPLHFATVPEAIREMCQPEEDGQEWVLCTDGRVFCPRCPVPDDATPQPAPRPRPRPEQIALFPEPERPGL